MIRSKLKAISTGIFARWRESKNEGAIYGTDQLTTRLSRSVYERDAELPTPPQNFVTCAFWSTARPIHGKGFAPLIRSQIGRFAGEAIG